MALTPEEVAEMLRRVYAGEGPLMTAETEASDAEEWQRTAYDQKRMADTPEIRAHWGEVLRKARRDAQEAQRHLFRVQKRFPNADNGS
jgi:hypothetical protein